MSKNRIKISEIGRDGGTQSRVSIDETVVREYADVLRDGQKLPPIKVFYDGTTYWLADGFHRVAAHEVAGRREIAADVRQGTRREAVLYSVGANKAHGLRRSNADKRRAVETLLNDDEWSQWSDREIAKRTGVSHPTVSKIRAELSGKNYQMERTVERNGNTYTMQKKHWGDSPAPVFWSKVKSYGLSHLDSREILNRIQKGAKHLTDLKMGKEEAYHALRSLALEEHGKRFKVGDIVKHVLGDRFGMIKGVLPDSLDVEDFKIGIVQAWAIDAAVPSSREEWVAWTEEENTWPPARTDEQKARFNLYKAGDKVVLRGYLCTITEVSGLWLSVESEDGSFVDKVSYQNTHLKRYDPSEQNGSEMVWCDLTPVTLEEQAELEKAHTVHTLQIGQAVKTRTGRIGVVVHANGERCVMVKDGNTTRKHYADTLTPIQDQVDTEYESGTIHLIYAYGVDDDALATAFDRILRLAALDEISDGIHQDIDMMIDWLKQVKVAALDEIKA